MLHQIFDGCLCFRWKILVDVELTDRESECVIDVSEGPLLDRTLLLGSVQKCLVKIEGRLSHSFRQRRGRPLEHLQLQVILEGFQIRRFEDVVDRREVILLSDDHGF